jgi:FPC/CPF motif-containing protein YcgG
VSQGLDIPLHSEMMDAHDLEALRGKTPCWWHEAYEDLKATLADPSQSFPCIYATRALSSNDLRFIFLEDSASDAAMEAFAKGLSAYLRTCRSIAPHTALLVFFGPGQPPATLAEQHAEFWQVLRRLHELDPSPWPGHIPNDPDEPLWEFCFDGEATFVLGSGPAHATRRTRHTAFRAISFQPRFMFDELIATPKRLAGARRVIRERAFEMDGIPVHPMIQMYHEEGNREWRQYVVPDDNSPIEGRCPFRPKTA